MHDILIEEKLQETLNKLFKKDKKRYDICMKKIEEIVKNPEQYKPLRYDLKNVRRVHIAKSFVLARNSKEFRQSQKLSVFVPIFKIEGTFVKFLAMDHHDKIYKR